MENPTTNETPWDVVDEASYESFPASDPPGWGSSHATTPLVAAPDVATPVIFVVIDLDAPQCEEALRHADVEARARGGTLAVCHVRSWNRDATAHQHELAALTTFVANTTRRSPSTFTVETASRQATAILARAEALGAELIVVRAPDRNRFAFGLVQRIVRYARCPVLVVRPPYGLNILVATDLVDDVIPTISAAAQQARWIDAPITTLHCAKTTANTDDALHRLASVAQQHRLGAEVSVVAGAPANAIVKAAFEIGADLVIIATHGRTGLWRWLQPSVAEAVVRHAPGSVLVVRCDAAASREHLVEVPS